MTETTRQIVRKALDQAVDHALPVLEARLQDLPPEARAQAVESAEGIRACLGELAEGALPTAEVQEALLRLIFGHGDPAVAEALRAFAEVMNFYLMDARDRNLSLRERRDS
jgi:hypothetical protein